METSIEKSQCLIDQLQKRYPGTKVYDLSQTGEHFVCELEPVEKHPEYDRAIEIIIKSQRHKHLKMIQKYTVIDGVLELHDEDKTITLKSGDKYTVKPGNAHWATSSNECWVEIYSRPGWTKEDHLFL